MVGETKMVSGAGAGASIKLSHELKTLSHPIYIAVTPRPLYSSGKTNQLFY
jgi:hypothetical protein